jgi:hypothetical protein
VSCSHAGFISGAVKRASNALRAAGDHDAARAMLKKAREEADAGVRFLSYREASESPPAFRALLLSMARSSSVERRAA